MDEMKIVLNTTNIRKVAFAVGFGLTMGTFVGGCLKSAVNGAIKGSVRRMAEEGSKVAQDICKKANVHYETGNDEPKMKCGFGL